MIKYREQYVKTTSKRGMLSADSDPNSKRYKFNDTSKTFYDLPSSELNTTDNVDVTVSDDKVSS